MPFNQYDNLCMWCGRNPGTEEHHLFRRSTHPGIKTDPAVLIKLCHRCHKYATESVDFEKLYQFYFFLKEEVGDLSVQYISEFMRRQPVISPRDISRFRNFLAGQYEYLNARFIELERQRPFAVEEFRKQEDVKSDTRANNLYEMTPDGVSYKEYRSQLKSIEKMLSALKTAYEQLQAEGRNIM